MLSRAGALVAFSRGYGIPRRAAGVTCASRGFVLHGSPHGLLLLAPQPREDQLTLQQEGLGFCLVPPFPLTKLPRHAYSHALCRGWKKRSSPGALALRAAPNWRNRAEPGCCPRVFRAVSPCCPLASPSPPLSQLFTSGFCFLDLLLCMRHVEGAPANIGHTLIVQQAGK